MKRYGNLFEKLCSYENLELAFERAKKGKNFKPYVMEFESNLKSNLLQLRQDLLFHSYSPEPLKTFIIREPKTRKISKSAFRDRIVHHALINITGPIFDRTFIYDSYANRKGKGTLKAIERFDYFKRKIYKNGFVLKADIRHYFDEVDHDILMNIISKRIKDNKIKWLIKKILQNHHSKILGKGMPLGNLTSQFFANVYLNELDYYAKHKLKANFYIRYVDDFIILHKNKYALECFIKDINNFLKKELQLELHPEKCKILRFGNGVQFLGFRIFYYHKLLRKTNIRKMKKELEDFKLNYDLKNIDYDSVYEYFQGWFAYANNANTYNFLRKIAGIMQIYFPAEVSAIEVNRLLNYI